MILTTARYFVVFLKALGLGAGDGSDFSVTIFTGGENVFSCQFINSDECDVNYNPNLDKLEVRLKQHLTVDKDTKFMFHCSDKGVPRRYDDCAYFCWIALHQPCLQKWKVSISNGSLLMSALPNVLLTPRIWT